MHVWLILEHLLPRHLCLGLNVPFILACVQIMQSVSLGIMLVDVVG